jgi:hypothetical protein
MSLQDAISGGNGNVPPANPSTEATVPAAGGSPLEQQTGSDHQTADNAGGSGTGEAVKLAAWTQQLSKDIRENPDLAGKLASYEKLDDFAKSYFELAGKSDIPGKDAKSEDVAAFWKRLGYPEKPENYTVSKEQNAGTFLSAAHAARLTDEQATALWKSVSEQTTRQMNAFKEQQAAEIAATDTALKKELGDNYPQAIELFKRGVGKSTVFAQLQQVGLAGKPEIIKAFIALGEQSNESGSPKSDSFSGERDFMNGKWDFPQ